MSLKRAKRKSSVKRVSASTRLGNLRRNKAPVSEKERRIVSNLLSRNVTVRSAAVSMLPIFGKTYEHFVVAAMKDPQPEVVESAIKAIGKINPRKSSSLIVQKIISSNVAISAQAIESSRVNVDRKAIPFMKRVAFDQKKSAYVRAMAVKVLFETFGVRDAEVLRAAKELKKKDLLIDLSDVK